MHAYMRIGRSSLHFLAVLIAHFLPRRRQHALGANALAVTAISDSYPIREMRAAQDIAQQIGIRFETVHTQEFRFGGVCKQSDEPMLFL